MISGLNQEVDVLGRTFHFQTELSRRGDLFVRTEVFVGGKIVATRESRVNRTGRLDEEALRALMKDYHGRVIESTVERVKTYQARKQDLASRRPPPRHPARPSAPAFDLREAESLAPPSEETRKAAASAVRIRRVFGKFRLRLGLDKTVPEDQIGTRLETAARGFAWIKTSPTFQEIRVDEQLRCNLVNDQVVEWLAGSGRDPARAAEIWSEIVTFNDYVAEINNRAELIVFDRQLLTWAAYQIQSEGVTDEVLDQLQWLTGRDPRLDKLLDKPAEADAESWFPLLCDVLARTPDSS